jgi:hypothetical protein
MSTTQTQQRSTNGHAGFAQAAGGQLVAPGGAQHQEKLAQPRWQPPAFLIPDSYEAIELLAKKICDAGWVPKSYLGKDGKPNQAMVEVGIMHGMMVGLPPLAALQSISIINGMPAVWGDGMLALVQDSGLLEDFEEWYEGEGDTLTAHCRVKRRGRPTALVGRFSWKMAKHAGLTTKAGPWTAYPARMMQMRARAFALRDGFADVLKGLRSAEEVIDGGDLVQQPDGPFVPASPRPTRDRFVDNSGGPVVDNAAPDVPAGGESAGAVQAGTAMAEPWPVLDRFGELVHEYTSAADYVEHLQRLLRAAKDHDAAQAVWEHNADRLVDEVQAFLGDGEQVVEELRVLAFRFAAKKEDPEPDQAKEAAPQPEADDAGDDWAAEFDALAGELRAVTSKVDLSGFLATAGERIHALCSASPAWQAKWLKEVDAAHARFGGGGKPSNKPAEDKKKLF